MWLFTVPRVGLPQQPPQAVFRESSGNGFYNGVASVKIAITPSLGTVSGQAIGFFFSIQYKDVGSVESSNNDRPLHK